jgi:UDP-N-acetylmuramate--alanine ligase
MCDIYAASESPIEGVTSEMLLDATRIHGQRNTHYLADVNTMAKELMPLLEEGDLVLTLGAGDIYCVGEELLCELNKQEEKTVDPNA